MSLDFYMDEEEEENVEDVFLIFRVGEERYAVGVLHVLEIVRLPEINHVPRMPRAFAGVMNLRGSVIPVMDMQSCFELGETERTDRTVIIVLELDSERVGMMVEEVTEVREIDPKTIEPTFKVRHQPSSLVRNIAQVNEDIFLLLDLQQLLGETPDLADSTEASEKTHD